MANSSTKWQYLPVHGVEQRLPGRHGAKSSPGEIKIVTFCQMPHRESSTVVFIHKGNVWEAWGNMLREDTEVVKGFADVQIMCRVLRPHWPGEPLLRGT